MALVQHAPSGGRVRREYGGLITLTRSSGLDARNADHSQLQSCASKDHQGQVQRDVVQLEVLPSSSHSQFSMLVRPASSLKPSSMQPDADFVPLVVRQVQLSSRRLPSSSKRRPSSSKCRWMPVYAGRCRSMPVNTCQCWSIRSRERS